ncbi:MAG: hypothetical protein ACO2ON_03975 [Candidatus Nanopusillus sp.]
MGFENTLRVFLNINNIYKDFMLLFQRGYKITPGVYGEGYTPSPLFCNHSETVNEKVYKLI